MARIKYYYDTESCKYERVRVSTWDIILNFLGFIAISMILAVGMMYVYGYYFDSPKEALLKKENQELMFYYEVLNKELESVKKMLSALEVRDDNVYRVIFGSEPIPSSIRNAGVGGVNRYKDILNEDLEMEDLVISTKSSIDKLKKKMYIQSKSYDELMELAQNKEKLYSSMPAIQPVSNKNLRRLSSGYGMRIDPILKVRQMHPGIDFSAPIGTPVYATGDGVVKMVRTSYGGYGKRVEIDHGFGFITRYAHLDSYIVKRGQEVKRGECIGYVGNTGKSTAPHLHYEIIKDYQQINPVHYFYKDLSPQEYEEILELASIENQSLGSVSK
ncbi:MAG TPA: M23 family metallopeptidase [Cyclobacteriaceae bacterium]